MKVGELAYMTRSMIEMGCPELGTIIGIKPRCYIVGFPNGTVQPFNSRWVSEQPIKRRKK